MNLTSISSYFPRFNRLAPSLSSSFTSIPQSHQSRQSTLHALSHSDVQSLFARLAPLTIQACARYGLITSQLSSSSLSSSQKAQHTLLQPIAYLSNQLQVSQQTLQDTIHIFHQSKAEPEMRSLASEEIQTLQQQMRQTSLQIISHLLHKSNPPPNQQQNQQQQQQQQLPTSAIVEIRAGAGGDEAALFVSDLFSMYEAFAARHRFRSRVLSRSTTTTGGLRELILRITAPSALHAFRFEAGVHRVQRVPATETAGRLHTSTASVAVLHDDVHKARSITLRDSDVKVDVYRASGAGGQHVNKTESAVRLTHIPTGLIATSQEDRSQHRNKAIATESLISRIAAKRAAEEAQKRATDRRAQLGSTIGERGDRIRTYNFPQRRVTDHRIVPSANLLAILPSAKLIVGEKSVPLDAALEGGVELDRLIDGISKARELELLESLVEEAGELRCEQSDAFAGQFSAAMEAV